MKVSCYLPAAENSASSEKAKTELNIEEGLSDIIFHSTNIEEAIKELQREGYDSKSGPAFYGINWILHQIKLEQVEALKTFFLKNSQETCFNNTGIKNINQIIDSFQPDSDSTGPVKTGSPLNSSSFQAFSRLLSDDPDQPIPLEKQRQLYEHITKLKTLEKEMRRVYWGYDLNSIDENRLKELLGPEPLAAWKKIKSVPAILIKNDLAERAASKLSLTTKGLQKITRNILKEIFDSGNKKLPLQNINPSTHYHPYITQQTKQYEFGDDFQIDTVRTILNTFRRTSHTGLPVYPEEQDFEVFKKEPIVKSATVVLLDLSKSMRFQQRYVAAKKVAFTLYGLVRSRYSRDQISVICFSTTSRPVSMQEIPFLKLNSRAPYTNMEEALRMADHSLSQYRNYRRQVFIITDGVPTAHRRGRSLFFQSPPHITTLHKTMQAAEILRRREVSLSIFLLAQEKSGVQFMHEMAKKTGGRVFHLEPENLGRCLLMDYLSRKKELL